MSFEERAFDLVSGDLRLKARSHAGARRVGAVVLHPHPQYGGDMDNHVVVTVCEALAGESATTVRFNFRGTGGSEGSFDNGRGEADDARAAIGWLREQDPDRPVLLVGYSFGAMVAAAAAEAKLAGLVVISPPLGMVSLPALPAGLPVLVVSGDSDPVSPASEVRALGSEQVRTVVIPGADHGWWPGIDALQAELLVFVRQIGL